MTIPTLLMPTLVMILAMSMVIAVLLAYTYAKRRFNYRKLPFQCDALRPPGETLRSKVEDLQLDLAADFTMILVVPVGVYAIHIEQKAAGVGAGSATSVVLTLTMVVWLTWRIVQRLRRVTRIRIGYAGEVVVGEALNQLMLEGYRVFHDVPGDKAFNVDHVVVGPAGVFAVETKTRTKKERRGRTADYKVTFDGKALSFEGDNGRRDRDFLDQSQRNAKWLSHWLTKSTGDAVAAKAVLVLPGWYVVRTGRGDALVMNHKEVKTLPSARNTRPLERDQIERIVHQLDQRCRNVELAPRIMRKAREAFS